MIDCLCPIVRWQQITKKTLTIVATIINSKILSQVCFALLYKYQILIILVKNKYLIT